MTYQSQEELYSQVEQLYAADFTNDSLSDCVEVLENLAVCALKALPYEKSIHPEKRIAERAFQAKFDEYVAIREKDTRWNGLFAFDYAKGHVLVAMGKVEDPDSMWVETFDGSGGRVMWSLGFDKRFNRMAKFMFTSIEATEAAKRIKSQEAQAGISQKRLALALNA